MNNHDPWWPRPQPTSAERIVAATWLILFVSLVLGAYNGWRLLGPYDKQAAAILAVVGYVAMMRFRQSRQPNKRQQALYVARSIHALLDGSSGDWDWDDFISTSLPDAQVDHLRRSAAEFPLPIGNEDKQTLWQLAEQASVIASTTGR